MSDLKRQFQEKHIFKMIFWYDMSAEKYKNIGISSVIRHFRPWNNLNAKK